MKRVLGRSGIEISAMGVGSWTISGPFKYETIEAGWGAVDDSESARAIRAAVLSGVNFFDTAANYGAGHAERVLGEALAGDRPKVVIATKFGYGVYEHEKLVRGVDASDEAIRRSCEASLRRLRTDYIDLFQFHVGNYPLERVPDVLATLEALVSEGAIRAYGWSTDDGERAARFSRGEHCASVQHQLNVLEDHPAMLALCESKGLASINRAPLAMGLLTGKYSSRASFEPTDIRSNNLEWMKYFKNGQANPDWLARLEAIRHVLTSNGRTLAQGALAWLWARSPVTVPIPGFRTVAQVEENARALEFGPLAPGQMDAIDTILGRTCSSGPGVDGAGEDDHRQVIAQ
jgi:aryl-alcohol dehydrogenase-like predicted oxidoreductase